MPNDISQLNSVIAELCRKTKAEPNDEDYALLKSVSIRDVALFFESVAQEKSEQARYDKLIAWLHNREEEKLSVVRRAEEEKQAKIRAEEEAKRKAEEAKQAAIQAEEDRKRKAEEDRLAAIKAEADKKAAAEKADAEAKAAAEAAKAKAEEEEKIRKEEIKKEKMKTCVGQCEHCQEWIDKKAKYLECDDMLLHPQCLDPWQEGNCPKCGQCGKLCTEDFVNLSRGDEKVSLHEECAEAYKAANK